MVIILGFDKVSSIVIDDDVDTVSVFADYLKLKQINVLGCGYNGKEAVQLFQKHKPDVVFLDHRMPEYDGLYALYNIRQIDPDAKIIMITADNTVDLNPKILELQPSAIIHKPFNIDKILQTVERVLDEKTISKENGN